ncbi:MAG: efflux RND transporter periplasmic adaptor subunit [Prevotella sp.]|jgi:membrane fusion protein (multidrug efflux system)|nr:efflux RND transporter periplasmic adaptor subunit [Prevotella sp.]
MKIKSILCIATVAAMLISCSGKRGGQPNFGDDEYPVVSVGTSSSASQTTYPATIKGVQDVEIRPKVAGFITRVNVREGQSVGAGQLLFVIDNVTYQAAVRQAQAAVNTAKAQMNTSKLTYENNQKLHEQNVIGDYELKTAKNSYETAQAAVAQAEAALASARENLNFCYVKSPSSGVIGSLPYKVGAMVSASSMPALTTVSNNSSMEVYFSMTEKDILNMTKTSGTTQAAIAAMPTVKLQLADGTIYNHPGKVTKMSGVIDAATGSAQLIAVFPNPNRLLKSGGSGSIIVPHDNNSAIVVPQSCVSEIQDKKFIYTVGKDNKVKFTEIKVAPQNDGNNYVVTEGLSVGDRYITNGITKLTDGQEIKPITPQRYQQKIKEQAKSMTSGDIVNAMKN